MDSQDTGLTTGSPLNNAKRADATLMAEYADRSPLAMMHIDAAGIVNLVNEAALALLKLQKNEVAGRPLSSLFEDSLPDGAATDILFNQPGFSELEFKTTAGDEVVWLLVCSVPVPVLEGRFGGAWLSLRDITLQKKREDLSVYLSRAATSLASARDTATALTRIADFVVPSFADWFSVDVLVNGQLEAIVIKHQDAEKVEWARRYRKTYPPDVDGNSQTASAIKSGKPVFIPVLTEEMIDQGMPDPVQRAEVKKIGLHSVIMAPMSLPGQTKGIVNFISSRASRHFDEEDLQFALNFASLIHLSLENTRLNEEAQNEIKLRRRGEQRFRFLLDAIPHKMWTSAADGHATYYNKQWYEYTGIKGFKKLKEEIWGIIHPEDIADAAKQWPEAIKRGEATQMEHRLRRHDGVYHWHLSRVSPIKAEDGPVAFWVGTSTDINDQKNYELELARANEQMLASNEELTAANEELEAVTEEQLASNEKLRLTQQNLSKAIRNLENSKRRFQGLLDSIPQIAWAGTATGEVTYYNRRWYEYTGLNFEQTRDWGWQQVIHPDDLDYNLKQLDAIIKDRQAGEFEIREKDHNGNYRWHLVRMTPMFDAEGVLEQWVGTATDIDHLKQVQQQKDDFISIASHELKTPLTSLRASVQLLYNIRDNPSPDKFRKLIDQAHRSLYKLSTLVEDLLDVNKFKEAKAAPNRQWFILSELVSNCCNHIVVGGRHELSVHGDKTLEVNAEERAIDQVIVNFVNNAVKYAPMSRKIDVFIARQDGGAKLSVRDYGPGIPTDQAPFVFDRYYQGGKQDYRNPGLGLGLYISAEIIKRHGGTIGVDSELGQGSTFWFTLPEAR